MGVGIGPRIELLGAQKQRFRGQGGALGVALDQTVAVLGVLPEALERRLQIAMQHDRGVWAHVVEHRGGFLEEQRQVVLDTGRSHAGTHILVDAALGRVALQQLAPAAAKAGAGVVVHRELAPGQQAHLGHRVQAALAVGVEGADGVDLVVEQVHPVGHGAAHGEQVDQPTAHRVFAGAHHLGHVAVARQRQLGLELGLVQLLLDLEFKRIAGQKAGRCQAVQGRGGGHDDHIGARLLVALGNSPKGGQALADQVLVRREGVVGQGFPIGEQGATQAGSKEGDLVEQALGIVGVGGDDGGGATCGFLPLAQARQQQGIGRTGGAWQRVAFTKGEFGQFHGAVPIQNTPRSGNGGCHRETCQILPSAVRGLCSGSIPDQFRYLTQPI